LRHVHKGKSRQCRWLRSRPRTRTFTSGLRFLFDAKEIMEAWGFEYKSCFVWVKPQLGMGHYWRVSHEFLLLGVKGSCQFADRALRSWGEFERGKHSAKPQEVRTFIESGSPGARPLLDGSSGETRLSAIASSRVSSA
jgi:hypothetical protein